MANNITNKDLQQNVFQEGGTHDAAPVTYRPVRPILPIGAIVTPGATLPQNSAATNKAKQNAAVAPPSDALFEMNFRGVWQNFVTYNADDVVLFNGSLYLALSTNSGLQPDNNHDAGPAEGSAIGSPDWTLISENLVFNPVQAGISGPGFGLFSARQQNNTSIGNAGSIGPIVTLAPNQIGFLVSCQSSDNVPASWIKIFSDGFSDGAYVKTFPSITTINDTLSTSRGAQLILFNGVWNQPLSLTITSVTIVSNVVTCQCTNNFILGTQVTFQGLSGANFLNGSTATITAVTPTSFQVSFTHANYGPTADNGTAINLPYLQTSGLLTGISGNPSFTFPNPVKLGSVLIACATSNDTNYVPNINSISTTQGDSFSVLNSNGFVSGSAFSADIAYAQSAKGGNTTISLTVASPSSALKVCFFEMPGGVTPTWQPYDVTEFRGSTWVCLSETSGDAFTAPNNWGLLGPGTGYVNSQVGNYNALASDSGHLFSFNSSSATTLTLPNPVPAPQSGISETGWYIFIENLGTGTLTISRNGLTIDGSAANLTLGQNQGVGIFADPTGNYETWHGVNSISVPGIFTVTAPNGSGQITLGLATESANTVWAGPTSGGAATPTFRLLVNADLPVTTPTVPPEFTLSGNVASPAGVLAIGKANEPANSVWAGPVSGAPAQPIFRPLTGADVPTPNALAVVEVQGTLQTGTVTGTLRLPGNLIPPKGVYRVSVYMEMAANPSAGSLDAQIGWTSLVQARTASNGTDGLPADVNTAGLNFSIGRIEIVSDGIHDITYTITLT